MEKIPQSREAAAGTEFAPLYDTPEHWPRSIHRLPLGLFDDIGRDPKSNELYWDGQKLVTEKRFSTFERALALCGLAIAAIGVTATVVQAWAAVQQSKPLLSDFQACVDLLSEPGNDDPIFLLSMCKDV